MSSRSAQVARWAVDRGIRVHDGFPSESHEFPDAYCRDFGKYLHREPALVLVPSDRRELTECLAKLSTVGMRFVVRGAGHSSGGQSLIEGGAIVDTRSLNRIVADDPSAGTISVEGGALWLDVMAHLHGQRRRPVVLTDNWRTTVAGTLSVGGFGDTSHLAGLQIESVTALTVVRPNGVAADVVPGDALFDYTLAGRGRFGVIARATVRTIERDPTLTGRVLRWKRFRDFMAAAVIIQRERRFEYLRARVSWTPGAPVWALAGNQDDAPDSAGDATGLGSTAGEIGQVNLYERFSDPPPAEWEHASPAIEFVLPLNAAGMAALGRIHRSIASGPLAHFLPRGSSVAVVPGSGRHPLSPVRGPGFGLLIAVRPMMAAEEVETHLPALRAIGREAVEAGGRLYQMSISVPGDDLMELQFGDHLRSAQVLADECDPQGLIRPALG